MIQEECPMISRKRINLYCAIFSVVFAFSNCYVHMLSNGLFKDGWDNLILLFNTAVIAALCFVCLTKFVFVQKGKKSALLMQAPEQKPEISDRKYFWLTAIVIFLLWLPVFLAYYPGLFAYDVASQIPQNVNGYSTHHPLVHTLYLQFFYYVVGKKILGSYNSGIAVATVVQMIVFALMLSFSHLFLRKSGLRKKWRILLILFTGISPVFSMMAISMTKDILFAGFAGLCFTMLCFYWREDSKRAGKQYAVLYVVAVTGTILFRNNGLYPIAALAIALFCKMAKEKFSGQTKAILIYILLGMVLGIGILMGLQYCLHAVSGSKNEMLSLPYQQMACAYTDYKDVMTEEDRKAVETVLPKVNEYNPHISDSIKATGLGSRDLLGVLRAYIRIGLHYPKSYIKGFFLLDSGYLGITDTSFAEIYGTENRQGIFLSDTKGGFDVTHTSLFPALESLYEKLYTSNDYQYVLGLNVSCSPALYFWMICFLFLYGVVYKVPGMAPAFAFLFVLVLTILAGPCALVRYALPYILCIPSLAISVLRGKKAET